VETGFSEADVVVEGYYATPHVEHAYLQPEAGLAYLDDEDRVTVICAAQWAHDDIHQIAHALDVPEDQVREIVPAIGGAFGGREDISLQILLALATLVTRRPVKMIWTREESFRGHGKRHPFFMRYKHGARRDGTLVAMEAEIIADAGAYASTSTIVLSNATTFAAGPYVVPNARIDSYAVYTNNAVTMAMRGFGATQMPVGYESQMAKLAEALDMDPVELRLKNLYEEGSIAVTGNAVTHGIGAKEPLREAALAAGWRQEEAHWVPPAVEPASAPHLRRGLGVACGYKNVGYSMGFEDKSEAIVELRLREDGDIASALIRIAASEVGQGVSTALAQIAAETLGVPYERVRMSLVDTARAPDAGSSSASRHTYMSGNAVFMACQDALQARDAVLREETGQKHVTGQAVFHGRTARATTAFDPETGQCEPHIAYTFASQIALVEVDTETGEVEILKMWASTNSGKAINPAMVFGQVAGGIHMGVGYALTEHFIQEAGRIKTRGLGEYYIPTILDMPRELVHVNVEVAEPTGPYGATGIGETTTLPTAPAILNAIQNATGARLYRLPAEPETVWRALHGRPRPI
jgi:CO/xanthine dehydrogenase Mo-binding subunit